MAEYRLGKICPIFLGEWTSGTSYSRLDVVYYDNSSYLSLSDSNTDEPSDSSNTWVLVAKGYGSSDIINNITNEDVLFSTVNTQGLTADTIEASTSITINNKDVLTEDSQRVTDVTIDQTYDDMVVLSWDGEGSVGGRDETILAATSTLAGVMSAADKVKLDSAITGVADFNLDEDEIEIEWNTGDLLYFGGATTTLAGLMTAADKTKLDQALPLLATIFSNMTFDNTEALTAATLFINLFGN